MTEHPRRKERKEKGGRGGKDGEGGERCSQLRHRQGHTPWKEGVCFGVTSRRVKIFPKEEERRRGREVWEEFKFAYYGCCSLLTPCQNGVPKAACSRS